MLGFIAAERCMKRVTDGLAAISERLTCAAAGIANGVTG
jgi:hypothetical protein